MSGKRKAVDDAQASHYDAKLTTVTRALSNLTRLHNSDELTSGTFDEAPFPGLRLKGDADDVPLPLTRDAVDTFVRKATNNKRIKQQTREINSGDVDVRNDMWTVFIEKIVCAVREPLGISDAAQVNATLSKLVLVQPGGSLPISTSTSSAASKRGVFGTLVVILPGSFSGGGLFIRRKLRWNPGNAARHTYGIAYAAFYNNVARFETRPISSGDALCLVYDLETSTIPEVPRFAGACVLEQTVEAALTAFFETLPLTKRLKIGDDTRRVINEFATDHRFVYPVTGDTFEALEGDDRQVADRMSAFCARSDGQYVLYLAELVCTRIPKSSQDEVTDADAHVTVSLEAPWIKYGESTECRIQLTTVSVNPRRELAPAGVLDTFAFESEEDSDDEESDEDDDEEDEDEMFYIPGYHEPPCRCPRSREREREARQLAKPRRFRGHALVVQPVALTDASGR